MDRFSSAEDDQAIAASERQRLESEENDPIGYCPSCREDRTFDQCSPLDDTFEYVCDVCGYVIETQAS